MQYTQIASKVVDGEVVVNWDYAFSDAQYYVQETDDVYESFLKIEDGVMFFHYVHDLNARWNKENAVADEQELIDKFKAIVKTQ